MTLVQKRSDKMLNRENKGKTASHKNGNKGIVVDQYVSTKTGNRMVTVELATGKRTYWLEDNAIIF